jgi:hypothetical protein
MTKDHVVWIDKTVKLPSQVVKKVKKANQLLGLIIRTFTYGLQSNKATSYVSGQTSFRICQCCMAPCLKTDIELIEKV